MGERPQRKRGRGSDSTATQRELVDAAFATVRDHGFGGATARAIAGAAGQNQAAIYYHFGGIEPLLIAALTRSSEQRLERYRAELADASDLNELVDRLAELHREDDTSGHLQVLSELLGGVTTNPELVAGLNAAVEPWLAFVEETVRAFASAHPLGALVPAEDLVDLLFSLFVGVELRNRLDGAPDRAERAFRLARLAVGILEHGTPGGRPG